MAPSAAVRAPASGSKRRGGQIERLRDGAQHAHRRIAGAAFDLRQIALGGFRGLRQLPARHAALGAMAAHFAADRGEECRVRPVLPRWRPGQAFDGLWVFCSSPRGRHLMHYSSCDVIGIMHLTNHDRMHYSSGHGSGYHEFVRNFKAFRRSGSRLFRENPLAARPRLPAAADRSKAQSFREKLTAPGCMTATGVTRNSHRP